MQKTFISLCLLGFSAMLIGFSAQAEIAVTERITMLHSVVFSASGPPANGLVALTGIDSIRAVGTVAATVRDQGVPLPHLANMALDSEIRLGGIAVTLAQSANGPTLSFVLPDLIDRDTVETMFSISNPEDSFEVPSDVAALVVIHPAARSEAYQNHFAALIAGQFPEVADAGDWHLHIHHGFVQPLLCNWEANIQQLACQSQTELVFEAEFERHEKTPASGTARP